MALFVMPSCASIVSSVAYPISVESSPPGAAVVVRDENGVVVHEDTTPFDLTLPSSDGFFDKMTYTFEVSHSGYCRRVVTLTADMDEWYWGNIVMIGGFVGFVLIDPMTGAMWEFDGDVNIELQSLDEVPPEAPWI